MNNALKTIIDSKPIVVAALYKFTPLDNLEERRTHLKALLKEHDVYGTLLLAPEGINGTISGPRSGIDVALDAIRALPGCTDIEHKESWAETTPFQRLKVRLKTEIVRLGMPEVNPNDQVGTYVEPEDWNELIQSPDVITIDTRNDYEIAIGSFEGAVDPKTSAFREITDWVAENLDPAENKKIAMYCTGGIRCEKASAYYKHKGFKNVYQLEGGIIEYTRQVREQGLENKFKGKNFVFDHRRSERISDEIIAKCHQCGKPCDTHVNCANEACHLLFIQCDECAEKMNSCCSNECKDIVSLPYDVQKKLRKGKHASNKIFKKGRSEALKFKN